MGRVPNPPEYKNMPVKESHKLIIDNIVAFFEFALSESVDIKWPT